MKFDVFRSSVTSQTSKKGCKYSKTCQNDIKEQEMLSSGFDIV